MLTLLWWRSWDRSLGLPEGGGKSRAIRGQRVIDFNTQLAQVCAAHAHCKFDDNAVFNYQFVLSQVSTCDYFHPNAAGQAQLADVTYGAGIGW
jgi:hypothetical protein